MDTSGKRRRNRSWPEALKREIVAASIAPGSSVSVVARRYDVNANQVFGWRKRYRDGSPGSTAPSAHQLMPVMVTLEQRGDVTPSRAVDIPCAYREPHPVWCGQPDRMRFSVGAGLHHQYGRM